MAGENEKDLGRKRVLPEDQKELQEKDPMEQAEDALRANETGIKAIVLALEGKLPEPEELNRYRDDPRSLIQRLRGSLPTAEDVERDMKGRIPTLQPVSKQQKYEAAVLQVMSALEPVYEVHGPLATEENKQRIKRNMGELGVQAEKRTFTDSSLRRGFHTLEAAAKQTFAPEEVSDIRALMETNGQVLKAWMEAGHELGSVFSQEELRRLAAAGTALGKQVEALQEEQKRREEEKEELEKTRAALGVAREEDETPTVEIKIPPQPEAEKAETALPLIEVSAPSERHLDGHNEDRPFVFPEKGAFGVADGVGGSARGEKAAQIAVDSLREFMKREDVSSYADAADFLRKGVTETNRKIVEEVEAMGIDPESPYAPKTTICVGVIRGNELAAAWVGDSRIYVYRAKTAKLEHLTLDNSSYLEAAFPNKRERLEAQERISETVDPRKELSDKELKVYRLRNQISGALGAREVNVEIARTVLEEGDTFLALTDGIHDVVDTGRIGELRKQHPNDEEFFNALVEEAKERSKIVGQNEEGKPMYNHPRGDPDDKTAAGGTYHSQRS